MTGIGYRQIGYYLCGEMSLDEAVQRLKFDTHHYAKRQMTWFKRDKSIQWLEGTDIKTAKALVRSFLGI
jgi:tRNA dimethylallyltransferase